MRRHWQTFIIAALAVIGLAGPARAADVICYNCPPQWADFASMLKAVKADLGYDIPFDNKNSGQALSQIIAEKNNPVADIVYYGVNFGMKAKAAGVVDPYKPESSDQVPAALKDPDGYWTTIHSGTLGLFINKEALGGNPVPVCWKDLLKPQYKGMVGYLDPSSAAVGFVGAVAVNIGLGGTDSDMSPAIDFFKQLHTNEPIVPKQTSYARIVSGEIPILFDYDFNAYRAKYGESGNFEFVIPCEGTVVFPYVTRLIEPKRKRFSITSCRTKDRRCGLMPICAPPGRLSWRNRSKASFCRRVIMHGPRALIGPKWKPCKMPSPSATSLK